MLVFLNAYGLLIGIIAGILGIIAFVESRRHPIFKQPGTVSGIVFAALCLIALTAGLMTKLSPSEGYSAGANQQGTSGKTTLGTNSSLTPTPTLMPSPTPSPSPTPPPPTQYVSNWTQGNDGWSGTQDWQVYGGMLHNAGQNDHNGDTPTITVPFEPTQDNYAVETVFMVPSPYYGYCFGITVRGSTTGNGSTFGYSVNISCNGSFLSITSDDGSYGTPIYKAPFDPGTDWHTMRIEVNLNDVKVYMDGGLKADVQDNSHPTGRIIGLWSDRLALNIKSFKVMPL